MENTRKESLLIRMINRMKNFWARLGEIDVNYGPTEERDVEAEVERIENVQKELHDKGENPLKSLGEVNPELGKELDEAIKARAAQRNTKTTNPRGYKKIKDDFER